MITAYFGAMRILELIIMLTNALPQRWNAARQMMSRVDIPRSNNAYLVIYDRVAPPEDFTLTPHPIQKQVASDAAISSPVRAPALEETPPSSG